MARKKQAAQLNKKSSKQVRMKKPNAISRFFEKVLGERIAPKWMDYDFAIFAVVFALIAFGVAMVYNAGYYTTIAESNDASYYLRRQLMNVFSGFIVMYIAMRVDYHRWGKAKWILALGSIGLLVLLFAGFGVNVNGAIRWFNVGPIRVTPSELSKLAMIIFTAGYLAEDPKRLRKPGGVVLLFGLMVVHGGLIIRQPNLSTAIVVCAIMLGIMFVAGLGYIYYAVIFAGGALGVVAILKFMPDTHWYSRLTNFIDPFADAQNEGYQLAQSLIALGNGGLLGQGVGNSISKSLYLPERQTDFILSIIGEEFGFIGVFVLMAVYLYLIYRCLRVAAMAKDKLGLYMASGVTIMLALQVIINVAVVTASMPATGITLPFISYGGTSLWVFMFSLGLVLNISSQNQGVKR